MEPQQLQTEYTDIKSVTHRVEHSILSPHSRCGPGEAAGRAGLGTERWEYPRIT